MNPALLQLAIEETPTLIAGVRSLFAMRHPSEPPPTNEAVIAAFQSAFASSLAKDDAWLAAHPADVTPSTGSTGDGSGV